MPEQPRRAMNPRGRLTPRRRLLIAIAAVATSNVLPQESEYRVRVTFNESSATRSFDDAIGGFEAVSYVVQLRQGQSLVVSLASNNISNSFDIYAPNESKPVYIGGDSGNFHRLLAKTSGDYRVKVFLLRLAARDNQSAHYTLELKLAG
jgi:hypothetical protein